MKHTLFLILLILQVSACNKKTSSNSYEGSNSCNDYNDTNSTEKPIEYSDAAKKEGYKKGYEDGFSDGYNGLEHGEYFNDRNCYETDDAIRIYKYYYEEAYHQGYNEGAKKKKRERLSNWHNWEKKDVDGIYIYMQGVDDDEQAAYYAKENYEGEYIREGWKYFAKINWKWGKYKIILGDRVSSNLYQVRGQMFYIHFRWGIPDVRSGNEGVLDWKGNFSSFYKKPDDL